MRFLCSCLLLIISSGAFSSSELIYQAQNKNIQLTEKDKSTLGIGEILTAQTLIVIGVFGFMGLRIWEIVDAWAVPLSHNSKYNELNT